MGIKKGCRYERNIDNFIQLCPSCHRKYDYTEVQRQFRVKYMIGTTYAAKKVKQIDIKGNLIKIFPSAREAERKLGLYILP